MDTRYQILQEGGVWDFQTRTVVTRARTPEAWVMYQTWLTGGGEPLPPDAVGQLDLAAARAQRLADIDDYASGLRNRIVRGRSAGEMAGWALKLLDALAVQAGQATPFAVLLPALQAALGLPLAPTSINHAMSLVRGISEADYAAKVVRDATQFLVAEVALDAVRGKHCDAVAALTDVRDIVVYPWLSGWPVLPG